MIIINEAYLKVRDAACKYFLGKYENDQNRPEVFTDWVRAEEAYIAEVYRLREAIAALPAAYACTDQYRELREWAERILGLANDHRDQHLETPEPSPHDAARAANLATSNTPAMQAAFPLESD